MVHARSGLTTENCCTLVQAFSGLEVARPGPWYARQVEVMRVGGRDRANS